MDRLKVKGGVGACAYAVLLLLAAAHAQAKEWRRLVPMRSTRAQVERRLGRPRRSGYHELKAERAFFYYTSGRGCAGGEGWDVPRDTVVRIVVTPKTKLRLSALRLDLKRFEKSADPKSRRTRSTRTGRPASPTKSTKATARRAARSSTSNTTRPRRTRNSSAAPSRPEPPGGHVHATSAVTLHRVTALSHLRVSCVGLSRLRGASCGRRGSRCI